MLEDWMNEKEEWKLQEMAHLKKIEETRKLANEKVNETKSLRRKLVEFKIIQEQLVKSHAQELKEAYKSNITSLSVSKTVIKFPTATTGSNLEKKKKQSLKSTKKREGRSKSKSPKGTQKSSRVRVRPSTSAGRLSSRT